MANEAASDGGAPKKVTLRDTLAMDRTTLANERTLLAYVRTAIGLAVGGMGLAHVFETPGWLVTGTLVAVLGGVLLVIGVVRFVIVQRRVLISYPE